MTQFNLSKSAALVFLFLFVSVGGVLLNTQTTYAGWVKGHTKSDGTYVNGYWKSNPNGLKHDNYSFDGDWSDAYNDSYYSSTRNYSSSWYKPTWVTEDDYQVGKSFYDSRNSYTSYSSELYDYDYKYWDDPIYNYKPSYSYGYDYMDSIESYKSPYSSYDNYYSSPSYGSSSYGSSYSSPSSTYGSDDSCSSYSYSSCTNNVSSSYGSSNYDSSSYDSYTSPSYSSPYSSSYDSYSSPSYGSSYSSPYGSAY